MIGALFRALVVAVVVLVITGGLGLVIMAGVADAHDVRRIPVPRQSSLSIIAAEWDYADAWRRPMEFNSYRDIAQVIENASVKGDGEIHRTKQEVVYAGSVPGMNFQVAYRLDRDAYPPSLEMVTVYKFRSATGKQLWRVYRPIHRCLAPYLLDRLGSRGPS